MKLSKDEIAERLREFLGLDIKFEKLPKDDLMKLYELFDNPENIIRILLDKMGIERYIEISNTVIKKKIIESKPIKTLFKKIILNHLLNQ